MHILVASAIIPVSIPVSSNFSISDYFFTFFFYLDLLAMLLNNLLTLVLEMKSLFYISLHFSSLFFF